MKKMNSLLVKGFQPAKCKTQLRLGTSRIKLLRNKKGSQIASERREVAEFLRNGQESNARLRVEHVIREQNLIEGYDLLYLYAERIAAQLPVIDTQKTCPPELKEDISTLLFASSRCAELPDFAQIRPMFVAKYGKEFVSAAEELRPGCGVNGRVIEKLSVSRASGEAKLQVMKDIAAEHHVKWDPAPFEKEIKAVPDDLLDGPTTFIKAETIDDFPSVPNQKPTLGTHLAQPDDFTNSNSGRFMEVDVEPTNSPRRVDDFRRDSQGARSGPPPRKPPGPEQSRTEGLSFDDRHTDMDPGRRETQPRRNSRRESHSFASLSSQSRHQDEESRRNSIGVPREKSGRARAGSGVGGLDESLPHEYAKHDRKESQGAEIDDFDGSHRSDRRQSRKYDQYEGQGQLREANAEPSSYTKNSRQAPTSQEVNHSSDEEEQGVFVKTRPGTDGGRRNQTRQDKDFGDLNYSTVPRKEGSGKSKPRNQDQDFEEDYNRRVSSREGSGKARAQYQDQESDEHNLSRAASREGYGKERTYHEDQYVEEQHLRRPSSKEGKMYSRETSVEEDSHGRISGRGKEGRQYAGKYRRHDDSDEDADHVLHRSDEPRRRDSTKNTPKYVDDNFHNPEWDSEVFRNSVTTRTPRNAEDEYRESGEGTRRDSKTFSKKDNEISISDAPHYGSSEYDDDPRGGGARKPGPRHDNFKGTNTRNSDRSSESGEEGSRQSTRRTPRFPSVDERKRDTLDDRGSSRGKKYGREDPDSLKTSRNPRFDSDPVHFDDDNFTTSSKAEKGMNLPGGSVRDKSKYQGNRARNDYDDTVRTSGRRATVGPEEIRPVRVRETEDPPRSRYGEREKHSDRRVSAPFAKDDIMEGRQSPNYSSQRDRSDRHRKGDVPAVYDDDRPPRFSNSKGSSQASLDDEHLPNTRAQMDRPRKPDISSRHDDDKPPRFIGKQQTLDDEDLPSGRSSLGLKGEKPGRFSNSPRRSNEPLRSTPQSRSKLQSVKTDPDLSTTEKTPAPEHRKSQSASDGQPQSKPTFMKPPDLDDLIQMFGNKGKKK